MDKIKKLKIAKKWANVVLEQIEEVSPNTKKEIIQMIKDAEEDFINGGYENFNIKNEKDIIKIAKLQSKILRKKLL